MSIIHGESLEKINLMFDADYLRSSGTAEENIKELKNILYDVAEVHEALADSKKQVPEWKMYSDWMVTKMFMHVESICQLMKGSFIEWNRLNKPISIVDPISVKVIYRAFFETFLMYHFIYIIPKKEEEIVFRFNVWLYSGLKNRQKLSAETPFAKQRKKEDLVEINKLKEDIANNPNFLSLTPKQRKKLIDKGDSRLFKGWEEIIIESKLNKMLIFDSMYSVLSMHAHTESISIMQIKDGIFNPDQIIQALRNECFAIKVLLSVLAIRWCELEPIIKIRFYGLPTLSRIRMENYSEIGIERK
jgi:hypothetical protein